MTGDHDEGTGDSTRQPQPIITPINDITSTLKIRSATFNLVFVIFCVTTFILFAQVDDSEWYHFSKYHTTSNCFGSGSHKNTEKEDHDVLENHVGRPRCFDPMIKQSIIPQTALAQDLGKRHEGKPRCFGKSCRETTMFSSHGVKIHSKLLFS